MPTVFCRRGQPLARQERWQAFLVPVMPNRVYCCVMSSRLSLFLRKLFVLIIVLASGVTKASPPYADIHVHFNWDQKETISADEVVKKLRARNAQLVVVAGTPSHLALELAEAGGDFIVPLFSPYTHVRGRQDWFLDDSTLRLAEEGLAGGMYRGIGEVHFMSGFPPRIRNERFRSLLELARKYDVPVLIHVDSADASRFITLCTGHSDLRILFAHAGGNLKPRHIREVIEACDNVLIELSARDPWRYGGLTDEDNILLPGWREVIVDYPDRFAIGTDPVWRVTRTQSWDQSDDGWDYYEQVLDWVDRWIAELPPDVQQKLRLENAQAYFFRSPEKE